MPSDTLEGGLCAVPTCGLEVYRLSPSGCWHHRRPRYEADDTR